MHNNWGNLEAELKDKDIFFQISSATTYISPLLQYIQPRAIQTGN